VPKEVDVLNLVAVAFVSVLLGVAGPATSSSELLEQVRAVGNLTETAVETATELLNQGEPDKATQAILEVFPETTRTTAENYVLGNILFSREPQISYELHKRAAADRPNDPLVLLEWAMQQQRAKEYEGAAATWQAYCKVNPGYAPALGLLAECLLQTGKTREAVTAWADSEKATNGTLETFESFVCDIHRAPLPDQHRADLLRRVALADIAAAQELVCLDSDWEFDWWNSGPHVPYLKHDLVAINRAQFPSSRALDAALCTAKVALAIRREDDVKPILKQYGFLLDADATLPAHGGIRSRLISFAISAEIVDIDSVRESFGEELLETAMTGKDADTINLVARLYLHSDKLPEIDKHGWDSTGDPRFAASFLAGMASRGELKSSSKELIDALRQFPDSAEVASFFVRATSAEGLPMVPALEGAIKAEYRRFSSAGVWLARPSARPMAAYFAKLSEVLGIDGGQSKVPASPKPQ
jgi:tetratricopeptide (TPR) repeat protein